MRPFIQAAAIIALTQTANPYAGTWTAEYSGTTYVKVVVDSSATLHGMMSVAPSIHTDPQGEVDTVAPAPSRLLPMLDVRADGNVLSFGLADGAERTMILREDEVAQLQAEHIPLPKPFQLRRIR